MLTHIFDKGSTFVFMLRDVNMGRKIVLDGFLERSDTKVLALRARRHMCIMCANVEHQAHKQNFDKKFRILVIFGGPKIF